MELPAPAGALRAPQIELEVRRQCLGQAFGPARVDAIADDPADHQPAGADAVSILRNLEKAGTQVTNRSEAVEAAERFGLV